MTASPSDHSPTPPAHERADTVIIGGGVVGTAVAAALAGPGRPLLLLEKGPRLGEGITSRNSGVIHSGLYYRPGSLKAQACVRGNRLLYEWAARTGVWHQRCGKLVVAQGPQQLAELDKLADNAAACDAPEVTRLGPQQLREREPEVPGMAALLCAATGIIDPAELVQSLRAAAEARGAVTVLRAEVTAVEREAGGFVLETTRGPVRAARVVNAAGLHSDRIARLVGFDDHTIHPCRGDYFRLVTRAVYRHLIYPVKDPGHPGLGIHLTLERGGGYRLGPDAEYVEGRDDFREATHKHALFHAAAERLLGPLRPEQLRYDSCGIRPKLRAPTDPEERDFVLAERPSGFVHLIGIESPGLTSALALAELVAALLG